METIVKIKWDEPSDKNWLCPDNIKIALSAYCPNTNFEVGEVDSNLLDPQVKSVNDVIKIIDEFIESDKKSA